MKHAILTLVLTLFSFSSWAHDHVQKGPDDVCPLKVGESLPDVKLQTVKGKSKGLLKLTNNKPTILVFYRGGWCPYCNEHLSELAKVEEDLLKMGYQVLAISTDRPEELSKTSKKIKMDYTLLSDASADAMKAFGLGFVVDEDIRKKYEEYGIDLAKASGKTHYILPVPAVFVIDASGTVTFQHVNPNYKVRLAPEVLMAAAKASISDQN